MLTIFLVEVLDYSAAVTLKQTPELYIEISVKMSIKTYRFQYSYSKIVISTIG